MSDKIFNVLFLCTGNSARSIMAEAILGRLAPNKFRAFSAGSHPAGHLHPEIRDMLKRLHYDIDTLRPKSWDEFLTPDAPQMDFVFTLCDDVAKETCPAWPAAPMVAHWGVPDPRDIKEVGAEGALKLAEIYKMLDRRLEIFVNLRIEALDKLALKKHLDDIGQQ